MLTGKWTPMNTAVLKFNQLVQENAVHSGENGDDHMSRVYMLHDVTVGGSRLLGTDEEPEHFGDDELPRPPVRPQSQNDRARERESEDRRRLIQSQRIAEDMRVLQIDTRGMDAADAAIINAQKARIRAAYPPPPN
ncbi:hypothetical protein Tco_1541361 [Tanacetum coccineum]